MVLAITGHRPNKLGNDYDLTSDLILKIRHKLERIIVDKKPTTMISGMALGIDTLWAELALKHNVPLVAAIPCKGHSAKWPQRSVDRYMRILNHHLTKMHFVSSEGYTNTCMQDRNKWMVDNADALVAVWNGSSGGTANCVKY